jgi:SAM-dependent methyltransferase
MKRKRARIPVEPLHALGGLKVSAVCFQLVKVCGPGRLLLVDVPDVGILARLLGLGINASAVFSDPERVAVAEELAPGRAVAMRKAGRLPFDDLEFTSVAAFVDADFLSDGLPLAAEMIRASSRTVALVALGKAAPKADRVVIESAMIQIGVRKHPGQYAVAPYGSLDEGSGEAWFLFERAPDELLVEYPLEALRDERDLHMDMTREAGRRSDAHIARYIEAAGFVREGDHVLDAACGLGYGSYAIARTTRAGRVTGLDESEYAVRYAGKAFAEGDGTPIAFHQGDAEDLSFLADASVDLVVSVETLEHLHHPEVFLAEALRVLTPGGRLYVSVPNDWSDETGDDPNPHHHHVYDWPTLSAQLRDAGYLVERAWTQDAGGGMRLHDAKRAFREFDPAKGPTADGEWILALAMKPPGKDASVRPDTEGVPNIIAFHRDYRDPSLVRSLVAMGWRATSAKVLEKIAQQTLKNNAPDSADAGAALCVLAYRALSADLPSAAKRDLYWSAMDYVRNAPANPTVFRWQVSLGYVAGLLALSTGEHDDARTALEWAARADALRFSPLLGTKTVGARVILGRMSLASGDVRGAARHWRRALATARRLLVRGPWREVVGELSRPQTFGLSELSLVVVEASRAANGLRLISDAPAKGGLIWEATYATLPDELRARDLELSLLRDSLSGLQSLHDGRAATDRSRDSWVGELHASKNWLERQFHSLNEECLRLRSAVEAADSERKEWDAARSWMLGQIESWQREAQSAGAALADHAEAARSADEGRAWLEAQVRNWQAQTGELQSKLNADLAEAELGRRWAQEQLSSWQSEVKARDELLQALNEAATRKDAELAELETGRRWLEEQLSSWQSEVKARDELLQALNEAATRKDAELAELETGRRWLEQQLSSWQSEVKARDQLLQALNEAATRKDAELAELDAGRQWLEGQMRTWQAEAEARGGQVAELSSNLEEQAREIDEARLDRRRLDEALAQAERQHAEISQRVLDLKQANTSLLQAVSEGRTRELALGARVAEGMAEIATLTSRLAESRHDREAVWAALTDKAERLSQLDQSRWVRAGRWLRLLQKKESKE